ncbi:MAG: RluA family pseudouridine synthase [Verrucomicrobia bacterium]|nr:MAG: RluA family pseudouridine synthase [Verrucomicrobiota bacterium]
MSQQLQQFVATSGEAGITLQEFLAAHLRLSKGKAKELLDQRIVFVNGRRIWMARHELRSGDEVAVQKIMPPAPTKFEPRILFEDASLIVVDKPAGMLTNGKDSLEERLRTRQRLPALEAVHRLDRETSGCLLLAKNPSAREALVALFGQREVTKVYHAIAAGRVREDIREIRAPVDGEPALTRLELLDASPQASHLKLNIETGRTHQIRKHLLAIRHPVLGDKQYGGRFQPAGMQAEIPRQMLHSAVLAFTHPLTGATVRCIAHLPQDFRACLHRFRLH